MKKMFRSVAVYLVSAAVCLLPVAGPRRSASAAGHERREGQQQQAAVRDVQVKRGAEVAARVRQLRETNRNVRAALREFEKRGRRPKINDAVMLTGAVGPAAAASNGTRLGGAVFQNAGAVFQNAGFPAFRNPGFLAARQQTTLREGNIELTLVTTLDLPDEWQGTIIARGYDSYGNLLDEYVANAVLTAPPYDHTQWTTRYETSFVDGAPYLMHQPGMFTGFALGTAVADHQTYTGAPPPLDIEGWQFPTYEIEQQYYQLYPSQWQYQTYEERQQYYERQREYEMMRQSETIARRGGATYRPAAYRKGAGARGAVFRPAVFQPRSDRSASREELRAFCGNPNGCGPSLGQVMQPYTPRIRSWAVDTGARCAAAAGGCALASAIFAQVTTGPCFVAGCAGSAIYNVGRHIFQWY